MWITFGAASVKKRNKCGYGMERTGERNVNHRKNFFFFLDSDIVSFCIEVASFIAQNTDNLVHSIFRLNEQDFRLTKDWNVRPTIESKSLWYTQYTTRHKSLKNVKINKNRMCRKKKWKHLSMNETEKRRKKRDYAFVLEIQHQK